VIETVETVEESEDFDNSSAYVEELAIASAAALADLEGLVIETVETVEVAEDFDREAAYAELRAEVEEQTAPASDELEGSSEETPEDLGDSEPEEPAK
jgi:hypothetical protein